MSAPSTVRRLLFAAAASLALLPTAASAADPTVSVRVSTPYTWTGSSVTVTIRANTPGTISMAQGRRYVIRNPGGGYGSCGWDDKYFTGAGGLVGPLLGANQQWDYPVAGAPLTIKIPATSLQFGDGDLPWNPSKWDGCRTAWTQYNRLGVWWTHPGGLIGPYWAEAETLTRLTRIF